MFEAEALEFPFMEGVPKREKSRLHRVWEHFAQVKRVVEEKGMFVPQHLVAELFGVSRARVGQFIEEGRLEAVEIHGVQYVTERSVVEFAKLERKNGRPPKLPTSNAEMWEAAKAAGRGMVAERKAKK